MFKKLLIISLISISSFTFAQEYEFGEVSKDELLETVYDKDTSANAAVLYKSQKTFFSHEGQVLVNTEIYMRIKIYNQKGFDYATQEINLFKTRNSKEKIYKIKGITYNLENGAIQESKLDKDRIFENEFSYNINQIKFTMPNVKEGSVIEFKYLLTSPFYSNIDELVFQYDIPINKLDVEIRTPRVLEFKKTPKGFLSFSPIRTSKVDHRLGMDVYIDSYKLNDIPALLEEKYAGNIKNYRAGVMLELVATNFTGQYNPSFAKTWEDVASTIGNSDDYEKELDKSKYVDDFVDEIIGTEADPLKKLQIIFNHVKSEIKWNGNDGKYFQKGMKKALDEHLGNAGDINLTLVAMLRYAGIDAHPVVMSTKDNGVPFFPTVDRLNYVVAYAVINNEKFFLDATDEFSDINLMPTKNYNWQGVYINNNTNTYKLISINKPKQAIGQHQLKASIDVDGTLSGSMKSRYSNHYALEFREDYKNNNESDFIASREDYFYDIEISDYTIENIEKVEGNILESFNFILEDAAEIIGDDIYIEPLLLFKTEENPFKLEERLYPIDFGYSRKDQFYISINIPEGYTIKTNVDNINMKTPNGNAKFVFNTKVIGNTLQISCSKEIVNALVPTNNYKFIKQFYSQIISKGTEKIILTKS
ncbi:transglutaminase domain-containing protein [Lacinutrix iliipiscaria]|uniref:Transglutaminase domain-containing protein n=1 Tax=Lacinutrix iliipiscaria TaxID=1230532 RepID=A0ABW5WHK8_9FLAO